MTPVSLVNGVLYALAIVLAGLVGAVSMRRWCEAPARRFLGAALAWYMIVLYALAWWGVDWYVVKAGMATRIGVILALILVLLEVRSDAARVDPDIN